MDKLSQVRFSGMRPDMEVVDLLERALQSARMGHTRGILVVPVNPINEAEVLLAGDLSQARANAIIGGAVRAVHKLTRET